MQRGRLQITTDWIDFGAAGYKIPVTKQSKCISVQVQGKQYIPDEFLTVVDSRPMHQRTILFVSLVHILSGLDQFSTSIQRAVLSRFDNVEFVEIHLNQKNRDEYIPPQI